MDTVIRTDLPRFLTPVEAAAALRVSVDTIRRLCRTGDLQSIHIAGPGTSIRIPAAAIDELLGQTTTQETHS
jgi:excisionase family DNA binding protein